MIFVAELRVVVLSSDKKIMESLNCARSTLGIALVKLTRVNHANYVKARRHVPEAVMIKMADSHGNTYCNCPTA
jgi:hypothetical protein